MAEGKNDKSNSQKQSKEGLRCDREQYNRLTKEGVEVWNKWREENYEEEIWLQRADLEGAKLQGAKLAGANLQGAYLSEAKLQGADLILANLQRADLKWAKLQGADLGFANLRGADLVGAELQGAKLWKANLQGADLWAANLQEAELWAAELQGAIFRNCIVDGTTSILECCIDQNTDFRNTGLDNVRMGSGTKYLLKYNVRRLNWKDWYKKHSFLQGPVRLFWALSNYGTSTGRVVATFFGLALIFAAVYYVCGLISPPGVVYSLFEGKEGAVPDWLVPFRTIYFSIVTMTTLGFGDMHANCQSFWGHLLLTLQVIFGYVLLGALVTRLAVLFTADGPAGSFTPMDKETKELLKKLKE